jgi:hypothetical protein
MKIERAESLEAMRELLARQEKQAFEVQKREEA